MKGLTRIMTVTALLFLFLHFQGMAQGLVKPPTGLPEERWELTFDDYRALAYDKEYWGGSISNEKSEVKTRSFMPPYDNLINLKRNVIVVRDGNDVYIKGIFQPYADAWIKGTVNGDKLTIRNNQIIDTDGPIYFHWGSSYFDRYFYTEWAYYIYFKPEDNLISFIISDNFNMITSKTSPTDWITSADEFMKSAFWFDNDEVGDWMFGKKSNLPDKFYGLGYPDVPYMINMKFRKTEDR